ncbi:LPO_1073/Vpar_1526 family protein [Peribacillus frigoritolerans]|uniref:LPO_1073/Vpar_1526 family protein n=1 Tax=Peribacillus frigoritolerans TaxID=450367 RepID=UPI0023DBBB0C|nr:LPO_1073/Vpar_1526 family protein [Peribacillus frigoritolerans]MDF1997604.1 hypothetical protein [Peribacillus frigoritolerans]
MKNNQNDIVSGDESTNIQGRDHVTVNQYNGLSYLEVKEIAMDVFKSNFYELGERASRTAKERAEQITNDYLRKLEKVSAESINNVNDPDVQYGIYTVQMQHARLGNKEISELLVDVLVSRTKIVDEPLLKLVLNESLLAIPKLTLRQIDVLSFLFIVKYVGFSGSLEEYISMVMPFSESLSLESSFYQHLQYAGCISISMGESDLNSIFKNKFPNILDEVNVTDKLLATDQNIGKVQHYWQNSIVKNSTLTSVGIAIAHANFVNKTGILADLSIWIKE